MAIQNSRRLFSNGTVLSQSSFDGYTLSGTGIASSPWIDLHSVPFFRIGVLFNGSGVASGTTQATGILGVYESSDRASQNPDPITGLSYPASSPSGSIGDPVDISFCPSVQMTYTGLVPTSTYQALVSVPSGVGQGNPYVFYSSTFAGRWIKLKYTDLSKNLNAIKIEGLIHWKSQSI